MLTLVPTPIGNLEDISLRSIKALEKAEIFFCEDTRVTKKLLSLLKQKFECIFNPIKFISIHSHNEEFYLQNNKDEFIDLVTNYNCVYMSDAGMPCVSDPASLLVDFCIKHNLSYDVLSGANALLMGYAMSGFNNKEFLFYGFLQHKSITRENELRTILKYNFVTILYESPNRIVKLINEIANIDPNRIVFIAKELTKKHQKIFKDSVLNLQKILKTINLKGEWVVIIEQNKNNNTNKSLTIKDIEELDIKPKIKAKLISKLTGQNIKDIYTTYIK